MRVLITRPIEDAVRTAVALRAAGHEPLLAPIFAIRPVRHVAPTGIDALIATSANALRHAQLGDVPRATPVFTVGDMTAAEAQSCGFSDVRSASGDSADLAALLRRAMPANSRIAWLCGLHRRDEAIQTLADIFTIQIVETYENAAMAALPEAIATALKARELDAALHFSRRSADMFAQLVAAAGLEAEAQALLHVFISQAAQVHWFSRRSVASTSDLPAMVVALGC
jgi:uroporphyrinogen-III synthase